MAGKQSTRAMTRALNIEPAGKPGMCTVSGKCLGCRSQVVFTAPEGAVMDWYFGAAVQDALPELDLDQREWLVSGICGGCFDRIWEEATA